MAKSDFGPHINRVFIYGFCFDVECSESDPGVPVDAYELTAHACCPGIIYETMIGGWHAVLIEHNKAIPGQPGSYHHVIYCQHIDETARAIAIRRARDRRSEHR